MSRIKKSISLALALLMLLSVFTVVPLSASAETYTSGDWEYQLLDSGTLEIKGYNGSETELIVPGEIDGKKVTRIGNNAFENRENITSITLPNGIEEIGSEAFQECSKLNNITLPETVKTIGDRSFAYCFSFTEISLPDSVTEIGEYAFECPNVKSVLIPKSVKSIGHGAFGYVEGDRDEIIILGYKDTAAEQYATINRFEFIPQDIEETTEYHPHIKQPNPIQVSARDFIVDLEGDDVEVYPLTVTDAQGEVVYTLVSGDEDYFSVNESTGALIISAETEEDEYTIKIKVGALGNENYISKYITKTIILNVSNNTQKTDETEKPEYEYRMLDDGTAEITKYNGEGGDIAIPSKLDNYTVTAIGENAFSDDDRLEKVVIPEGVKRIENLAFFGSSISGITLPETLEYIGMWAFQDCESLDTIIIPKNTQLEERAFYGTSFKTISVDSENPYYKAVDNVLYNKNMDTLILYPCGSENKAFSVPSGVKTIGAAAFWGCGSESNNVRVTLPDTLEKIDRWAFVHAHIDTLNIPANVNDISYNAFLRTRTFLNTSYDLTVSPENQYYTVNNGALFDKEMTKLICCFTDSVSDYIVPETVKVIGSTAFQWNRGLRTVTLPDKLESIEDNAFSCCHNLQGIKLPDGLKSIGEYAFEGCFSLGLDDGNYIADGGMTSVTIPSGVTSIGYGAFGYWSGQPVPDTKLDKYTIYGYSGSEAERYAEENEFEFISIGSVSETSAQPSTDKASEQPTIESTEPAVTEPIATEPVTPPVVTEPTQPNVPKPTTAKVTNKKENPIKVTVKAKTVKLKKLKKKAQKAKAITVKNAQGKVTYKLVKKGITKKIRKLVKIGSNGVLTIKKWKKAKKGTYKIKVKITAAGNSNYNAKTVTKTVKVKVK